MTLTPGIGTILIFGTLLGSVFIAPKLKVNVGIPAMLCAFIIGIYGCGMSAAQVYANFPVMIALTFILAMMFFGYIIKANVFKKISGRILYAFRNRPALIPYAIAVTGTVLAMCGCDATSNMAILGPIAYGLAIELGFPTIMAGVAIWAGVGCGVFPWVPSNALNRQIIADNIGPEYVEQGLWFITLTMVLMMYLFITIVYIATKSYKINKANLHVEKPEPFTHEEKKVLYVLIGFIVCAALPPITNMIFPNPVSAWCVSHLNIYVLFLVGIVILNAMNIEKASVVLKECVSWELIIMLAGTTMLIKLLPEVGAIEMISGWLSNGVPVWLVTPALFTCGAILTLFTNGMVAAQTLSPIWVALSTQVPGISLIGSWVSVWTGTSCPTISPFSTGGALTLMSCPEEHKEKQTRQQIYVAGMALIVGIIIALSGWFGIPRP